MSRSALWVDEELQEEVRKEDGDNDIERLKNWAENYSSEKEQKGYTESEIKDLAEERFIELQRSR